MASDRGSKSRDSSDQLIDQKVRPAIEALKFVPAYQAAWRQVVAKHGRAAVRKAARRVRPLLRGTWPSGALYDDLRGVLRWSPMPLASPVDPDDPEDDGGGIVRATGMYRAIRRVDLPRLHDLVAAADRLGRVPGGNAVDPWIIIEIDMRSPLPTITKEIKALRARVGLRTTQRPGRRMKWADRAVGFAMLRARRLSPKVTPRQLARRFLGWSPDDPRMPHDVQRRVRKLLQRAEESVADMTSYVEAGCPTLDPFIFSDSTDP